MPLLLAILGLFLPRVLIVLLFLFSNWFSTAFGHWIIPLLGFIFLPYTLLWYSAAQNWFGGVWGPWQIIFLVIAIVLDISAYGSARR